MSNLEKNMEKDTKWKFKDYLYLIILLVFIGAIVFIVYNFWDAAWNFRKQHPWTIVTSIIGSIIAIIYFAGHSDNKNS